MFIVQSTELVKTEEGELLPLCRYVMPAGPAMTIMAKLEEQFGPNAGTCSKFDSYERRYAGQDLNHKRLLMYRHSAFGDALMVTAVARYLADRFPEARIDVYCHPRVRDLWWGTGARAYPGFPPFDAVRKYDYHLLYDGMLEANWEDDQRCAIDDAFAFAGIDPTTVPDEAKRPCVVERPDDIDPQMAQILAEGKYLLYHCQASSPARTYPPHQAREFIDAFLEEYPGWHCYVVGLDDLGGEVQQLRQNGHPRCWHVPTARFRNLIPLVKNAGLIVCPDSAVGHLAAAFPAVPVISLWGMFHPNDRVQYYANHHPLFAPSACLHSPCRVHTHVLPLHKCVDAVNALPGKASMWCHALAAITPAEILDEARKILSSGCSLNA